jgi:hypothetical protein
MAITVTEQNSYSFGGHANRTEIVREVTITGTAAGDFADGSTVTAAQLNFATVTRATTVINATGQAIDLIPKFDRSGYLTFKKGAFTPTDFIFKGVVTGR